MPKDPAEALSVLHGLRIRCVGRALDMLWIHFGDYRTYCDDRGKSREVGEWALHVQCPWRFVHSVGITLASADVYFYANRDEPYDFRAGGESVFDRKAAQLNRVLESGDFRVSSIAVGVSGTFELECNDELRFSVFPNASYQDPTGEFWRMFRPDREGPHYAVSANGFEIFQS